MRRALGPAPRKLLAAVDVVVVRVLAHRALMSGNGGVQTTRSGEERGMTTSTDRLALLGAGGTMGFAMARNLARAGFEVRAWNRTRERAEPLADDGATVAATPAEAAEGADVLITMLSDTDAVLEAMEGADGALAGVAEGTIWLQMSTVGLSGTERCAESGRALRARLRRRSGPGHQGAGRAGEARGARPRARNRCVTVSSRSSMPWPSARCGWARPARHAAEGGGEQLDPLGGGGRGRDDRAWQKGSAWTRTCSSRP